MSASNQWVVMPMRQSAGQRWIWMVTTERSPDIEEKK